MKVLKTTEIYTHITNRGIENIKNPIDDFDFDWEKSSLEFKEKLDYKKVCSS